jgi:serine 3-dehydrogenase
MATAFITGVTSGIGRATAKLLVGEGWKVVGTGRRQERLDELRQDLSGEQFLGLAFDLVDPAARADALANLPAGFRDIDLLVNNAGLALGTEAAQRVDLADWMTMINVNVIALTALTHSLLPALIERKGMIVNIGSVAATYPYAGGNVYGATKAFVRQFALGLRSDLHGTGVRVTTIEPGMVETEFTIVRRRSEAEAAELYRNMTPLTADDIARAVHWAVSQPPHVNVNLLELMPTDQSFAGFAVHRHE